jgi:hypothetical protein
LSARARRLRRWLPLAIALAATVGLHAHHGSADYHVDREISVSGIVTDWKWTNPHTWVHIEVNRPGKSEAWNGEGPPLQWAAARGWSAATLKRGERVRLVMYPSRSDARGGLVKRIERDGGETLLVSRPWLDAK